MNLMNATDIFLKRKNELEEEYKSLVEKPNMPIKEFNNGIFTRYQNPVLTNQHIPLEWKFDFNPESNPYFLERIGFNAAFNAELVMKRSDLNDMFGNIMSSAAGFSPNIMAVPKAEFEKLRTEFARSLKSKEELEKEDREEYIPQELEFLSDVVEIED